MKRTFLQFDLKIELVPWSHPIHILTVWMVFGMAVFGCASFDPRPVNIVPFQGRAQSQTQGKITITAAALTEDESEAVFGVNLGDEWNSAYLATRGKQYTISLLAH